MGRQIKGDTDIADTRRKGAKSARVQVKYLAKFTGNQMPLHGNNCRVETFNMPNCKLDSTDTSEFDESRASSSVLVSGFSTEYIDAHVKHVRRDFKMQVSGDNYGHEIGVGLFHQLVVIAVTLNMKPAHCVLQAWFVRFRNPYNLNLLLVKISEDA